MTLRRAVVAACLLAASLGAACAEDSAASSTDVSPGADVGPATEVEDDVATTVDGAGDINTDVSVDVAVGPAPIWREVVRSPAPAGAAISLDPDGTVRGGDGSGASRTPDGAVEVSVMDGRVRVDTDGPGAGELDSVSGAPPESPVVAASGDGELLVAWAEQGYVVATRFDGAKWERLGPEALNLNLRVGRGTPFAATFERSIETPRPVVVYRDDARFHTTRWDGGPEDGRWRHISPGLEGDAAAATSSVDGDLLLAVRDDGEVVVRTHVGGPNAPLHELVWSSEPATCAFPGDPGDPGFPQTLSETGCYADIASRQLIGRAIPYEVKSPLFSDGAGKRRYLILPDGALDAGPPLGFSAVRMWKAPAGTIAVKEFDIRPSDGAETIPMETRFSVLGEDGSWRWYSYQWNDEGTQATLREDSDATATYAGHEHLFPSRQTCVDCHLDGKELLGVRTLQLNRPVDYGDTVANQIDVWVQAGLVVVPDGGAASLPLVGDPEDVTRTVEDRVRSYFDGNCAHCHLPEGTLKLRYDRSLLETNLCDRIAPGNLDESTLWVRVALGVPGPMPEQGLLGTDPLLTSLIEEWILDMDTCP